MVTVYRRGLRDLGSLDSIASSSGIDALDGDVHSEFYSSSDKFLIVLILSQETS